MRYAITLSFLLLFSSVTKAQHASLKEQKMCYGQANQYVKDINAAQKDSNWQFVAAHFDGHEENLSGGVFITRQQELDVGS